MTLIANTMNGVKSMRNQLINVYMKISPLHMHNKNIAKQWEI